MRFSIFCFLALTFTGCKATYEGLNIGGDISGKITIDGEPLGAGEVQLYGPDGKYSVSGNIRNDGSYRIPDPPMGECKIAVLTLMYKDVPPKSKAKGPVDFTDPKTKEWPIYVAIPKHYEDKETANLSVTIVKGNNSHDILLVKKAP